MPTGVRDYNKFMSPRETEDYISKWFPESITFKAKGQEKHFQIERFPKPDNSWLMKITELMKPGGKPTGEPLHVKLGTGPMLRDANDKALVAIESATGSEYVYGVGLETFQEKETPSFLRGEMTVREDPMETARDYLVGSFFVPKVSASGQRGKLAHLLSHGDPDLKLAGSVPTVAPHLLMEDAFYSAAQRVTHGFDPSIKDRAKAINTVAGWIHGNEPPRGSGGSVARILAGKVPYVESDGSIRWREASQTRPHLEHGQYQFDMFGGASGVKKLNVARGERDILSLSRVGEGGRLEPFSPPPVKRGEAGHHRLNIKWGTEQPPTAFVTPRTFMTPGIPDSGAGLMYEEDPRVTQGVAGQMFPTRDTRTLYPHDYDALLTETSFKWGIFDKRYLRDPDSPKKYLLDEEGKRQFEYVPRIDPDTKEQIPIEGYTLDRGETVTVGVQEIVDRYTGKVTQKGIDIGAGTRITRITDTPTLVMPEYYYPDKKMFSASPGVHPTDYDVAYNEEMMGDLGWSIDDLSAQPIGEEDRRRFAENMGGGRVDFGGIDAITLSVPIETEQAIGRKVGGTKEQLIPVYSPLGGEKTPRQVKTEGGRADVGYITAGVKSPLVQFTWGQLGTWETHQQKRLIKDLPGMFSGEARDETLAYLSDIEKQQEQLQRITGLSREKLGDQWIAPDLEDMSRIYRRTTGREDMETWRYVDEMYRNFQMLAQSRPRHTLLEYDYGLVDKPQYFNYKEIHPGHQPYLEESLEASVLEAQRKSKGRISDELAQKTIEGHYNFEPIEGSDMLMWQIQSVGRWGTTAGGLTTEHLNRGMPSLGPEGMAALWLEDPNLAKTISGRQEAILTPGQKAWRTIDQWYAFQKGGALPPEGEGNIYTSVSREQASDILSGMSLLSDTERNFEGWDKVVTSVLGENTADILAMDFGEKELLLRPRVAGHAAEYNMDQYGIMIEKSAIALHYPEAYADVLEGKSYEDTKKGRKFMGYMADIQETSSERQKEIQKTYFPGAGGKLGSIAGQLPPGYGMIDESQMRAAITTMAKSLDYPVFREGRINEAFLERAMEQVETQGYLGQYISSDPTYLRTDAMLPARTIMPSMARTQHLLNVPDQFRAEGGKAIMGGLGTFGVPILSQFDPQGIFKDTDLDEVKRKIADEGPLYRALTDTQRKRYDKRVEEQGRELVLPSQKFIEATGPIGEESQQEFGKRFSDRIRSMLESVTDEPFGGSGHALVGEMSDQILATLFPEELKEWQQKTGYERDITQGAAFEGSQFTLQAQGAMGRAYNIRRRGENVESVLDDYTEQEIADAYGEGGRSYFKTLEGIGKAKPPTRALEQLTTSLHPTVEGEYRVGEPGFGGSTKGRKTETESFYGIGYYQDTGGVNRKGTTDNRHTIHGFNYDALFQPYAHAALRDLKAGLVTTFGAVKTFATSGEMREEFEQRLGAGESPGSIIFSLEKREGYHFSKSHWGKLAISQMHDKIEGITGEAYSFSDYSSVHKREGALQVLGDLPMHIGGEQYKISEPPSWVRASNLLHMYSTRKQGALSLQQRALLEQTARDMERSGQPIRPMLRHAREMLKTERALSAVQAGPRGSAASTAKWAEADWVKDMVNDAIQNRMPIPTPEDIEKQFEEISPSRPYTQEDADWQRQQRKLAKTEMEEISNVPENRGEGYQGSVISEEEEIKERYPGAGLDLTDEEFDESIGMRLAEGGGGSRGPRDPVGPTTAAPEPGPRKSPRGGDKFRSNRQRGRGPVGGIGNVPAGSLAEWILGPREEAFKDITDLLRGQGQQQGRFGGFGGSSDKNYADMLLGSYESGVSALEEYQALQPWLEDFPEQYAGMLSRGLVDAGETPTFRIENGQWVDASGNAIPEDQLHKVEMAIPEMRAQLKGASPGRYEDIMREPRKLIGQLGDTHQKMHTATQAVQRLPKEFLGRTDAEKVTEMQGILRGDSFSIVQQLTGEKAAKAESTKNDPEVIQVLEDSFKSLKSIIDSSASTFVKLEKVVEELSSTGKQLSEEQGEQRKEIIAQAAADRAQTAPAMARLKKVSELLADSSGLSLEDRRMLATEGISAAKTIRAQQKRESKYASDYSKAMGEESVDDEGGVPLSEGMRKLFGGFGIFYMSRLASMSFGQFRQGQQERLRYDKALADQATALYGAGATRPLDMYAYAEERAMLQSAGGTFGNLQRLKASTSGFQDALGAGLFGIGAGLGAMHIGGAFAGAAGLVGKGAGLLTTAAPGIGLVAGLAMGGYSLYSNAQDYENSIIRSAAQVSGGGLGKISGPLTALGPALKDLFNVWGGQEMSIGDLAVMQSKELAGLRTGIDKQELDLEDFLSLDKSKQLALAKVIGQEPLKGWEGVSPTITASLFARLGTATQQLPAGEWENIVKSVATSMEAGVDTPQMAMQIAALQGKGVITPGDAIISAGPIAQMGMVEQQRMQIGLGKMAQLPGAQRMFQGLTDEQIQAQAGKYEQVVGSPVEGIFDQRMALKEALRPFGIDVPTPVTEYSREYFKAFWDEERESEERLEVEHLNKMYGVGGQLVQAGVGTKQAGDFTAMFAEMGLAGTNFQQRLQNLSPTAMSDVSQGFMQMGLSKEAQFFGQLAITDLNLRGEQTGLGLFQTSMQGLGNSAIRNAYNIFGAGWHERPTSQAATFGINKRTGQIFTSTAEREAWEAANQGSLDDIVGGQRGMQIQGFHQQVDYQRQQMGMQWDRFNLQQRYQGLFWGVEDRQRDLGYRQQELGWRQTEWGFDRQEQSMEMSSRQWEENFGLQKRQAHMQRQWAQEDWGYQDLTRSLQWGWQQEDFAENSRFMTGRQRRLAERGMERQTTMYNLETGQIETQRDRQKELWALEDERFALQKAHQQEQKKFQEENLAMQRLFFEEGKVLQLESRALQEESVALNRQYQLEQQELQRQSLVLQEEYMESQIKAQEDSMLLSQGIEDAVANAQLLKEKWEEVVQTMLEDYETLGIEFKRMVQSIITGEPYVGPNRSSSTGGSNDGKYEMRAMGGDMLPHLLHAVGGNEYIRPTTLGSIVTQYDIGQAMSQEDKWSTKSVFFPSGSGSRASSPQTINVYVGNDKLASFVLDTVKGDLEVL